MYVLVKESMFVYFVYVYTCTLANLFHIVQMCKYMCMCGHVHNHIYVYNFDVHTGFIGYVDHV